jgi:hypothetical protein
MTTLYKSRIRVWFLSRKFIHRSRWYLKYGTAGGPTIKWGPGQVYTAEPSAQHKLKRKKRKVRSKNFLVCMQRVHSSQMLWMLSAMEQDLRILLTSAFSLTLGPPSSLLSYGYWEGVSLSPPLSLSGDKTRPYTETMWTQLIHLLALFINKYAARGNVVGWGTILHTVRSRVRFQMRCQYFPI